MIGSTLSHFRIVAKLGEGGMGEVYLAEDTTLKREVALKILPQELAGSQERLERFQREAEALAALDHPNIVTIHSVEEADGVHFLTMQLVKGKPLSKLIPRRGLTLERFFEIAIPLSEALAAAHERGVIHRDLKPANVMVSDDGRVKVLDFGLAKLRHEAQAELATELPTEPLTEEGRIVGTMPYMSPEQLEGSEVDARSDIFSLGVMLYEMATGARPFRGDTSVSLITSIVKEAPSAVDAVRADLPHHLGRVITHCLEKDSTRRFQSAIDVRNELEALKREIESGVVQPSSQQAGALRPQHRRRWWPLAAAAVVVIVLLVALWSVRSRAPETGRTEIRSLAVLPLSDLAGEHAPEYFAEGMTEALITDLSKISALKVISRTSVMRYKGTEKSIPEIAGELGVDALVEGSVLLSGNDVRITAQLIDGVTDEHLWVESYTRPLENVLALHSEIARAIADEVEVVVTADEADRLAGPSRVDPEALQAYFQGLYFWNRRTSESFRRAAELFQQAIDVEPEYALAYCGLADTYNLMAEYNLLEPHEAYARAQAAALRALEIDDSLIEARTALTLRRFLYDWDWSGAEEDLRRIIERNPNHATARYWYSELLAYTGRFEEALTQAGLAQELSPVSVSAATWKGFALYYARQYDRAIEHLGRVLDMDPDYPSARLVLAWTYLEKGMLDEGVAEHERAVAQFGESPGWTARMAHAYAAAGQKAAALEILEGLISEPAVPPYHVAKVYAALGDKQQAFAWLERGFETRGDDMVRLKVDPQVDPLRDDPRLQDLMERMNFPE